MGHPVYIKLQNNKNIYSKKQKEFIHTDKRAFSFNSLLIQYLDLFYNVFFVFCFLLFIFYILSFIPFFSYFLSPEVKINEFRKNKKHMANTIVNKTVANRKKGNR